MMMMMVMVMVLIVMVMCDADVDGDDDDDGEEDDYIDEDDDSDVGDDAGGDGGVWNRNLYIYMVGGCWRGGLSAFVCFELVLLWLNSKQGELGLF